MPIYTLKARGEADFDLQLLTELVVERLGERQRDFDQVDVESNDEPPTMLLSRADTNIGGSYRAAKLVGIDAPEAQTGNVLTYSPALTLFK